MPKRVGPRPPALRPAYAEEPTAPPLPSPELGDEEYVEAVRRLLGSDKDSTLLPLWRKLVGFQPGQSLPNLGGATLSLHALRRAFERDVDLTREDWVLLCKEEGHSFWTEGEHLALVLEGTVVTVTRVRWARVTEVGSTASGPNRRLTAVKNDGSKPSSSSLKDRSFEELLALPFVVGGNPLGYSLGEHTPATRAALLLSWRKANE